MIESQVISIQNPLEADILVTDESGWPIAMIEVKNRPGLSAGIASSIRRNLMDLSLPAKQAPYFLVVSDEVGWLWFQGRDSLPADAPAAEFPMRPVVDHYASWLSPNDSISSGALEFVVADWLSEISTGTEPTLPAVTEPLSATGFLKALRGASVRIHERG